MPRDQLDGPRQRPTSPASRRDQRLITIQPLLRRAAAAALTGYGLRVSREAIDDLAQEATCRLLESAAWRSLPPSSDPRRLSAYLLRVARNALVDELRARSSMKRGGGRVASSEELAEAGRLPELEDPGLSPEEALIAEQERARLCRRLAGMLSGPHRDRNARLVTRWALDGWSGVELAAAEAGLSASSVHSVLWRVRQVLARQGVTALVGA